MASKRTFIQRANGTLVHFDAVIRKTETTTAKVSKHPVEDGFNITDHVSLENVKVSLDGTVSSANNSLLNTALGQTSDPVRTRVTLNAITQTKEVVALFTPEIIYSNLVITSLVFTKKDPIRDVINFSIRFEGIRRVKSKTSIVPAEDVSEEAQKAIEQETKSSAVTAEKLDDASPLSKLVKALAEQSVKQEKVATQGG